MILSGFWWILLDVSGFLVAFEQILVDFKWILMDFEWILVDFGGL